MKNQPLTFTAHAAIITCSLTSRTISGTITVFDVPSSDGRTIHAGSITPREPLNRVKLLMDHDAQQPVGYMVTLQVTPTQADATFYVPEGAEGDAALASASKGLRDGLSVGLTAQPDGYYFDDDYRLHITAAEMHETSLVAIPAFQDAQVTNVAAALAHAHKGENSMNPAQIAAALAAGTMSQPQADALLALATPAAPAAAPAPARIVAPAEFTAGPELTPAPTALAFTQPRVQSLQHVTAMVSSALATGSATTVLAALADIVPADDAGQGYIGREDWMGELWKATKTGRPFIDSFGTPGQLTSMTLKGWQWVTRPKPAKYAGNKAEVPSAKATTKPVSAAASRWAGGWDIDRIFVDLGDPAFLTDFWTAATLEYQQDSDFDVAAQIVAAATVTVPTDATVLKALAAAATSLRTIGATMDYVYLAEDIFAEYSDLKIADLPAWLANAIGGVSLRDGTANVGDIVVQADSKLAAGQMLAYDKRAATVKEKSPFQVQALDVSRGGIDLGFYSYGGVIVNDPRAIVLRKVTRPI